MAGAASAWAVLGLIERAIHYAVAVASETEADMLVREFLAFELSRLLGAAPPRILTNGDYLRRKALLSVGAGA